MGLLLKATEALWDVPPPLSGRRRSNHFLNGPADTEESLLVLPGLPSPLGGQVAQLRKNLGRFILYHEDLPRVLVRSGPTSETPGMLACGLEVH